MPPPDEHPKTIAVPFARAIIDVKVTPPWSRRNGCTPVRYSGREALRREQCGMTLESRNSRARRDSLRQRLGKHVPAPNNIYIIKFIMTGKQAISFSQNFLFLIKHHVMKTYGEWSYSSTNS
jgi:hypothetical protein